MLNTKNIAAFKGRVFIIKLECGREHGCLEMHQGPHDAHEHVNLIRLLYMWLQR